MITINILNDKTAIVTSAGRGIGGSIALTLARIGWTVHKWLIVD